MDYIMNPQRVLPRDLMELQLGQIDLLLAMYPETAELSDDSSLSLEQLQKWCTGELDDVPQNCASTISMILNLDLEESSSTEDKAVVPLSLEIAVPVVFNGDEPPMEPPSSKVRLQQPPWMSKAEVKQLMAEIPEGEDVLAAIERIKEAASEHVASQSTTIAHSTREAEPLVRVWFYFPSISTRSKRDDLINHAPGYGLTGFLLAGKPGILCLEGSSQSVDDYMKFIKTESWGDIPAHHKKVSERYRETDPSVTRVFPDMKEITDLVGERRGERANRQDMKALEAWLNERGLGEAFVKVLI